MANPPPISGSPSLESRSQNDHLEMDWDPWAKVATEAGEVVHGRFVRVKAWTYLFCSGGLVLEQFVKVRRGRKDVGGGL